MSSSRVSFLSSGGLSNSSATPVTNLIEQWENKSIASCVLGISKINMASNLNSKVSHSSLLLLQKEIDYDQDDEEEFKNETGIIIEYGDYSPDMNKTEKEYTRQELVKYHYGAQGGLRYYCKKYGEFIKEFGDIGYIDLNIDADNQQSFNHFINEITKSEDKKWIKAKYSSFNNFNCQTFSIHALKIIKPYFNSSNIYPTDSNLALKKSKKKLDFIPSNIKVVLMEFYRK